VFVTQLRLAANVPSIDSMPRAPPRYPTSSGASSETTEDERSAPSTGLLADPTNQKSDPGPHENATAPLSTSAGEPCDLTSCDATRDDGVYISAAPVQAADNTEAHQVDDNNDDDDDDDDDVDDDDDGDGDGDGGAGDEEFTRSVQPGTGSEGSAKRVMRSTSRALSNGHAQLGGTSLVATAVDTASVDSPEEGSESHRGSSRRAASHEYSGRDDGRRHRRELANSNERKRMMNINVGFDRLRSMLPNTGAERLSKASVLHQTVVFIEQLQQRNKSLVDQLQAATGSAPGIGLRSFATAGVPAGAVPTPIVKLESSPMAGSNGVMQMPGAMPMGFVYVNQQQQQQQRSSASAPAHLQQPPYYLQQPQRPLMQSDGKALDGTAAPAVPGMDGTPAVLPMYPMAPTMSNGMPGAPMQFYGGMPMAPVFPMGPPGYAAHAVQPMSMPGFMGPQAYYMSQPGPRQMYRPTRPDGDPSA
jgi:hypothetical protein